MQINLTWGKFDIRNFGDDLNLWLINKITGYDPIYIHPNIDQVKYLCIGSILEVARSKTTVWGSGCMFEHSKPNSQATYLAVRGKLTRDLIIKNGGKCPEIYGDPALLLPKFYKSNVNKEYELGIIPHYVDHNLVKCIDKRVNIVNIGDPIEKVIDETNKCKRIISSSLHGLILADSYGISNKWCLFSNQVVGDGFKFRDYFSSIGVDAYSPIDLRNKELNINELLQLINEKFDGINIDLNKLWDSCPFK